MSTTSRQNILPLRIKVPVLYLVEELSDLVCILSIEDVPQSAGFLAVLLSPLHGELTAAGLNH